MTVHHNRAEPWTVTVVDTGDATIWEAGPLGTLAKRRKLAAFKRLGLLARGGYLKGQDQSRANVGVRQGPVEGLEMTEDTKARHIRYLEKVREVGLRFFSKGRVQVYLYGSWARGSTRLILRMKGATRLFSALSIPSRPFGRPPSSISPRMRP